MTENILDQVVFGNTLLTYCVACAVFGGGVVFIRLFKKAGLKYLKKWSEKTSTTFDDFIVDLFDKTILPLGYFGAFYVGVNILVLPGAIKKGIQILGLAVLTMLAVKVISAFIGYAFDLYARKRGEESSLTRSLKGILNVVRFLLWVLALIFFMDNLGFKVSTVIAGLGIGGMAVALASQTILKDVFSYFSILFDHPFTVGDIIAVGDLTGEVEYIGVKTTRIRSINGEQVIFSNTDLTDSRIRNYKRMEKRRILFTLGLTYQTPLEKLQQVPLMLENSIKNIPGTVFERAHFASYGASSLDFEVVYHVIGNDFKQYRDIQQKINFVIKSEFDSRGIEFAYPTQTLFINKIE